MSIEPLRLTAFCLYLGALLVMACAAVVTAIPSRRRRPAVPFRMTTPAIAGMLMQGISPVPISLSLPDGPLRPGTFELLGAAVLAPVAAGLFAWAVGSTRGDGGARALVTGGAYRWLRHPMYLAFFAMLVATGLLASAGVRLLLAAAIYVAGSELRIASEEAELDERFPADYARYRLKTRWRYLPGLR